MNNIRKTRKYEAIRLSWFNSPKFEIVYYEKEDAKEFFNQIMKLEKSKKDYTISLKSYREEVPYDN